MKILKTKLVNFFFLLLVTSSLFSQTTSKNNEESYFKASGSFLNNQVFMGRQDSATLTPYLTPNIGFYHKSGLFINGGLSYITNGNSRVDLFAIQGGYDFDITQKLSGVILAEKDFYNSNSTAIRSSIKGYESNSLSYDFDWIQVNGGLDVLFGNKNDIALNVGLSHEFNIDTKEKESELKIVPEISANMSSLNYYEGYTNIRIKKGKRKNNPSISTIVTTTVLKNGINADKISLLDYELTAPITYDSKKWGAYFTPTIAKPLNSIYTNTIISTSITTTKKVNGQTITIVTPQPTVIEDSTPPEEINLKSKLYFEVGVYIKF